MRIEQEVKLDYADVLIRPKRSTLRTRADVDLQRAFTFVHAGSDWRGVPVMAANMDSVGTWGVASVMQRYQMLTCIHKHYTVADWRAAYASGIDFACVIASVGVKDSDIDKLHQLMQEPFADTLFGVCIDVANGYTEAFVDRVRQLRDRYPQLVIAAGNVVTAEMTEQLILSGADIVKVGIGPGSVCTTRLKTGVGYPQLSAVIECADAAHGLRGHIIADGGCQTPGDVAKAFAAGADFVMLGGMLAGHDECEGELITRRFSTGEVDEHDQPLYQHRRFKLFYGMSSDTAMKRHSGGVADYRASEGRTVEVPYRGALADTVQEVLGGVRSTCTYVGAQYLRHLSKCATFVRVNTTHNRVFEVHEVPGQ